MTRAVLSVGANLGDRLAQLQAAVDGLRVTPDVTVVAVSPVYETDPVGGPVQPHYLNAVVVVETTLSPHALLDRAHELEIAAGRIRGVRWGPRELDVDLVEVDRVQSSDARLTLPHPRAGERAFVLVPWLYVDPDARLTGVGRVGDLLTQLDTSGVRRRDDLELR